MPKAKTAVDIAAEKAAAKVTGVSLQASMRLVRTAAHTAARLTQTAAETAAKLSTHEAVCAERFSGIRSDIKALRSIVLWGGAFAVSSVGLLITSLAMVAWAFLKKELHLP